MRRAVVDEQRRCGRDAGAADHEEEQDAAHGEPDEGGLASVVICGRDEREEGREDIDKRENVQRTSPDLDRAETVVEHRVDGHLQDNADGAEDRHGEANVTGLHA